MGAITVKGAYIKAMTVKMGKGVFLTFQAPLTSDTARLLGIHSDVYKQDNTPKQNLLETKLRIVIPPPFSVRLEITAKDATDLVLPDCNFAGNWMSILQNATKKGKPTKLILQWQVGFMGSGVEALAWLERWRSAAGNVVIKSNAPVQATLDEKPSKGGKVKTMPKQSSLVDAGTESGAVQ